MGEQKIGQFGPIWHPVAGGYRTQPQASVKVVEQLLAAEQALPLGQHWRALLAAAVSPDRVTAATDPLLADGKLRVVLATPAALNVTVPEPSVAPDVDKVAVCPATVVAALVHGLLLLLQAVTITLLLRHARPALGSDSS